MKKIMVVDDEKSIATMLKEVLEDFLEGVEIIVSYSGNQAVEQIKSNKFNAILTDWNMSDGDGSVVLEYLSSIKSNIPVLINTGFSLPREEYKYDNIEVIDKPSNIMDVVNFFKKNL